MTSGSSSGVAFDGFAEFLIPRDRASPVARADVIRRRAARSRIRVPTGFASVFAICVRAGAIFLCAIRSRARALSGAVCLCAIRSCARALAGAVCLCAACSCARALSGAVCLCAIRSCARVLAGREPVCHPGRVSMPFAPDRPARVNAHSMARPSCGCGW